MKKNTLKYGMALIFLANLLNMGFSMMTNFFLPKYLTIDAYAQLKTFLMYVSYVGVLHLGYSDGMFLRYGGKRLDGVENTSISTDIKTMRAFQFLVGTGMLIAAFISKNEILIACALVIIPINMANYYRYLFQATGEFENYSRTMNFSTISLSVLLLILLAVGIRDNGMCYIAAYVIVDALIWMYLESIMLNKYAIKSIGNGAAVSASTLICNIKTGFFLMLGSFSDIILTGMDRWFIKALLDNTAFAMYSFAVSMEGLMNVVVTPISTTLYNYFCSHSDVKQLKKIKNKIILFSTVVVSCAFPAKFILENFLTNYLGATDVIFLLFGAQIYYIIIICFHSNLYKAKKMQKNYFVKIATVIGIGFGLNVLLYVLLKKKEAFAIGTMLCGIIWFVLSEMDFKKVCINRNEGAYLLLVTATYIIVGTNFTAPFGFVLYCCSMFLLGGLFMREDLVECLKILKIAVKKLSKGNI